MKKRYLYKLELDGDDAVIVYRNDRNYGRQGVIYIRNGETQIRREYSPYSLPNYIIKEAENLINNTQTTLQ